MTLLGLSPLVLAALIAAAAAALFALHHLRVRPEIRRVPTLLFWKEAVEETRARTLPGRFRHPRTFLFLAALAALLALALAEPETKAGRAATRHVVVVLDNGAALAARADPSSGVPGAMRFEEVRAAAGRFLEALSLRDRVAVLTTEPGAGPLVDWDAPRNLARGRVAEVRPAAGMGDLAGALRRAAARLAGKTHPQVVLFTGPELPRDLPVREGFDRGLYVAPGEVPLAVVRRGGAVRDRGIVGLAYGATLEVRVAHGESAPPFAVEVVRSGQTEPIAMLEVAPAGRASVAWLAVPGVAADGALVEVRLVPADGFPHNDRALYRLPLRRVRRVAVDPALPPPAGLLVREHPWLAVPAAGDRAELRLAVGAAEPQALPAGSPVAAFEGAALLLDGAGRPELPRLGAGVRPLLAADAGSTLLAADRRPLLQLVPGAPAVLEVAPGLLELSSPFAREPAAIAHLAALLERLAGNRPGAVAVPEAAPAMLLAGTAAPVEIADTAGRRLPDVRGLLDVRDLAPGAWTLGGAGRTDEIAVHPDRILPAGAPSGEERLPATPASSPRGWEWLALAVLVLVLIDAWLHVRGRIP
ncbi:MAG: hypothetical protein JXQ29_10150 [Planctomycetes bacterium]|nr:hypothetical protein [Planctomycetota bacterium]